MTTNKLNKSENFNISEGNVKEDNIFCNQKREENNTFGNLTELWKKGELEEGHYYLKNNEYIFIDHFNGVIFEETCDFEIKEVLAPVPFWEQWQQMKAFCEGFNALEVAEENRELKELLKKCNETFFEIRLSLASGKINSVFDLSRQRENDIKEVLNVPNK